MSQGTNVITESVLNFVDLAGSEKMDIHDAANRPKWQSKENSGLPSANSSNQTSPFGMIKEQQMQQAALKERVKEGKNINKSLFFLNQVISLRSQGKSDVFIPYRNSPLTKILRSSLGGNSRTAIILCVNPCLSQYEQTMSTIRFGLNAKKIENKVKVNVVKEINDELHHLMKEYEKKIQDMERERDADKTKSENLLQIIDKLQEQKKILAARLFIASKGEASGAQGVHQLLEAIKAGESKKLKWAHAHYHGVGILAVMTRENEQQHQNSVNNTLSSSQSNPKFDAEGKYALASLKNVKEQNRLLEAKLSTMAERFERFEKEKYELLQNCHQKERNLNKKRNALENLKKRTSSLMSENDKCKQVISLVPEQEPKGLKATLLGHPLQARSPSPGLYGQYQNNQMS